MRALPLAILALILLPAGVRTAAAGDDFGPEEAKALIPEAAGTDPELMQTIGRLGAALLPADFERMESLPLSLVVLAYGRTDEKAQADFRWPLGAAFTPTDFANGAIVYETRGGKRVRKYSYASIILPEYIRDVTCERKGDEARGTVSFACPSPAKPTLWEGRVEWVARRGPTGWRIEEFHLPGHGIRTRLVNGRWRAEDDANPGRPPRVRSAEERAVPSEALPRVGAIEDAPENAVVIAVQADGSIHVRGRGRLPWDGLHRKLMGMAGNPVWGRSLEGGSGLKVVLRVASSVPWEVVGWVLDLCSDPAVRVTDIQYAVLPEEGAEEGVLPAILLGGWGISIGGGGPPIEHGLRIDPASKPVDRAVAYGAYKRMLAGASDPVVGLKVTPGVAAGNVIRTLDVLKRAGAKRFVFTSTVRRPDTGSMEYVASHPVRETGYAVRILNSGDGTYSEVTGPAEAPPRIDRVRRAPTPPAGGVASPRVPPGAVAPPEMPPEEEELPPPPEEPPAARPRGSPEVPALADTPVNAALRWLAAHQSLEGCWGAYIFDRWCDRAYVDPQPELGLGKAQYDMGVTGLALLAFLGAGHTNRSEGPFRKVVGDGLRWLKDMQDDEGCIGQRLGGHWLYGHAIATIALLEAYRLTGSALYRQPAQDALDFAAAARNPGAGWRYGFRPGESDSSLTGWMALALVCGRRIGEEEAVAGKPPSLVVYDAPLKDAIAWLDGMTDPKSGRVGYQDRGSGSARPADLVNKFPQERTEALTALSVLVRLLVGATPASSDTVRKGVDLVGRLPPRWNSDDGSIDMDYWLVGSLAMRRLGGERWKAWREAGRAAFLPSQRTDGTPCSVKGSWDPIDPWGEDGGRVYSTAMMALCCEAILEQPNVLAAPAK